MIYTELTKKAMEICCAAHAGQKDKGGFPYVFHPAHVAEQMTDEETTVVALLHDVVEDTDMTLEELRSAEIPEACLEALDLLTYDGVESYFDYVLRVKENPIARSVKLADLAHNSDLSRLAAPTEKDLQRVEKYRKAVALLQE